MAGNAIRVLQCGDYRGAYGFVGLTMGLISRSMISKQSSDFVVHKYK